MWDLHAEKLLQKYQNYDETGSITGVALEENIRHQQAHDDGQVTHSIELRGKNSCPTALACSQSGNICFAAYTDDSLHMIDMRAQDVESAFKSGGHTGMIKSIWVSDDETICYTGGSDGTVRLWDIGTRSVIQTYG